MKIEKLVTMANQIGDFFGANPNQAEAKDDIAKHLKRFWAHNMRQQIVDHVDTQQGQGLKDVVIQAITEHRELLS